MLTSGEYKATLTYRVATAPAVAITVAVPLLAGMTRPAAVTVATCGLPLFHVTLTPVITFLF